ncbi:Dipeptide transport system permease protein DppC [archaeon HR01]|nr:Dipeptide transport system permease protein DppC [archaeon HR01]
MPAREWRVFWSSPTSKAGVLLLASMTIVSLYVLITYPQDFGLRIWNNPGYWADYPKEAPPSWVNLFTADKLPEHMVILTDSPAYTYSDGQYYKVYRLDFQYEYSDTPSFLSITLGPAIFYGRPPYLEITVERPDGLTVPLYFATAGTVLPEETPPYRRFDPSQRIFLSGEEQVARSLQLFLRMNNVDLSYNDVARLGPERIIFLELSGEGLGERVLKGRYIVNVVFIGDTHDDNLSWAKFVVGGKVYGLSGTDRIGRDLAAGLLFGFPVALLIGLVTSVLTTSIGSSLGIMSGYIGGRVDEIIQRVSDILNNIPLLPLLIFFTFIFKPSIWLIVMILVVFGWSGLTIVVRSIVLQVKSEQYVEAAVSLGAPRWRIMSRHVFPRIAPFILAQMILSTPSAILAEASLSFLGLGDPSLPSWGQMLDYSFRSGGVNIGLWWWIIPPGVLIVVTGLTFILLSLGLEPVVSPRLRRMR